MESFLFQDDHFTLKLSEQNDKLEVVKIPRGCHVLSGRVIWLYQGYRISERGWSG